MIQIRKIMSYLLPAILLVSCQESIDTIGGEADRAVELAGFSTAMSRAGSGIDVADLKDYVGRKDFVDNDAIVFTSIQRSESHIDHFSYKDLQYKSSVTTDNSITSIAWSRIPGTGSTLDDSGTPDRIYWSDATSPHTFIGYCIPQQRAHDSAAFDWKKDTQDGIDVFYGSLGNPYDLPSEHYTLDYSSTYDAEGNVLVNGNELLKEDDILLTHSTNIVAEDAIAKLRFHHGLAQVRVIVNISDFAAAGGKDKEAIVKDMVLKDMLTMYKWKQTDAATLPLTEHDQAILDKETMYGYGDSQDVKWNQKKDIKLWIPDAGGVGKDANRTFTFYALAVPAQLAANTLEFSFQVTYPDPLNPTTTKTELYKAKLPTAIHFTSGKCTTITINLNHRNEKLTVGAEYMDWEFVDSPDEGSLKKNSTFLSSTDRSSVTILGDANATADDATWLYLSNDKVVDIYGNDGSATKPFVISTAKQLLSFAYEVSGNNRKSVSFKDSEGNNVSLADGKGWDFSSSYVKLDADIHLQTTETVDSLIHNKEYVDKAGVPFIQWPGIGNAGNEFKGTFLGSSRYITHLYHGAFFNAVGEGAVIRDLNLSDVVRVHSHGALAENNGGFICACRVEGMVKSDTHDYIGSLCGTNSLKGFIFACIHNGTVSGTRSTASVGGLLGTNEGIIAVSYHTGGIEGKNIYGAVARKVADSKIYACYFNSTLANPNQEIPAEVDGRTLGQMQSKSFVETDLNGKIASMSAELLNELSDYEKAAINQYHFVFAPGSYPRVEKK